jgi:hypothetical protein
MNTWNQGKKSFNLTYLEQCIKSDSKEWIILVNNLNNGSGKVLTNIAKTLVLKAYDSNKERPCTSF